MVAEAGVPASSYMQIHVGATAATEISRREHRKCFSYKFLIAAETTLKKLKKDAVICQLHIWQSHCTADLLLTAICMNERMSE